MLGSWGRFLVMVAGGAVVIVAVVVVACFVGPGCWGFEYLRREEKKKKHIGLEKIRTVPVSSSCKLGQYYWLNDTDYIIYQSGPRGFEEKVPRKDEILVHHSKERVFNLKCAPLLVAPNLYSNSKDSSPKLEIKISYAAFDEVLGRLTVLVISATSLNYREYIATLDPFVELEVLNNKWSLQKSERVVHTVQTEVVKNATNPKFNETFVFEVKKIEIKNWCLKLTIFDNDRMTKVTPLFEKRVYLKDLKNLLTTDHISMNLEMQEVCNNVGALHFGISYLPTAQRLNINIVKASRLKYQYTSPTLFDFHPFVRVIMINNHGKCIKKKKTTIKHGDDSPVYNESLIFDVSISNLEQTVFLVLVCSKNLISNSDNSSVEGDIETSLRESKDKVLGTIVLGRNVKCTRARDHWVTVMQNPRKMISVWHDLR